MSELVAIGGIQPLMKSLLDAGLLHGECLTVTGATLAENLRQTAAYPATQAIVRPLSNPIKKDSQLGGPVREPRAGGAGCKNYR